MPTLDWLKNEFTYGYSSGDILTLIPSVRRCREERRAGGSYRRVFRRAVLPYLTTASTVLELGPGAGSWSRAILKQIPEGRLYTVDFQDVTPWLVPHKYAGRLVCHQVSDDSLSCIEDGSIDFLWSFGVLCHNNLDNIAQILENALPKMRPGAMACHQYAEWSKLQTFGWERGTIPSAFKDMTDDEIWWPRNDRSAMRSVAEQAGWRVLCADLDLLQRDGLILLRCDV